MGDVGVVRLFFSSGNHERAVSLRRDVLIQDNGKRLFMRLNEHWVSVDLMPKSGGPDSEPLESAEVSPAILFQVALDAAFVLGWLVADSEAGRKR